MLIFTHRGLKNEMPENTIPAFRTAFSGGFGIELDARMTLDKKIVVIHDKDPFRVTGKHGNVSAMTLFELNKLNINNNSDFTLSNIRIPTMREVCRLISDSLPVGQKAAFHIKYEEQTKEMLQTISWFFENYNLYDKAFVFDLTTVNAKNLKNINKKVPIAVSVGEENYSPTIYRWEEVASIAELFDYIWLDEWKIQGSVLNKKLIDQIHKAGKIVYAISPELHKEHGHPQAEMGYENIWKNLNKWGIDGICTAYPKELNKIVSKEDI